MKPNNTPEEKDKWFRYLDELSLANIETQRKQLNYAVAELNKIIFIIATGTFVLSISFIAYIQTVIIWPWLLILAWICLVIAIAGNMTAHYITFLYARENLNLLNQSRRSKFNPHWEQLISENTKLNWLNKKGRQINLVVFSSLAAGLLFLLLFGGSNLIAQNALREQKQQTATSTTTM